jgi:hypothetical protein
MIFYGILKHNQEQENIMNDLRTIKTLNTFPKKVVFKPIPVAVVKDFDALRAFNVKRLEARDNANGAW